MIFDQPFPIDTLSPESFERFCDYFISLVHPDANVHRYGSSGHKQYGLDVQAIMPDKKIYIYQCKRHKKFNPADVRKVVSELTYSADKKVLLLTINASPNVRNEIAKNSDWEVWDKEDISKSIRRLSKSEQIELVDTFFPGQRFALTGETEPGPWMSTEVFFEPFLHEDRTFNHKWTLVGQVEEYNKLLASIQNKQTLITMLVGDGGSGKSRILYQALTYYQTLKTGDLIKFLSNTEKISQKQLENLGLGEKLLIVDDAHDREDLAVLLSYVANSKNRARLVLSLRRYGQTKIEQEAARLSLQKKHTENINLAQLTQQQSIELATQVLKKYGGNESAAKALCQYTLDCPLATVVGAQIVAKVGLNPQFLSTESQFRRTLISLFQDVITGEISSNEDKQNIISVMRVLALVQPFSLNEEIISLIEKVEGIAGRTTNRIIKILVASGVIFQRGNKYRIAPDVLADHIIEDICVNTTQKSTGYAETVFDFSSSPILENILINLSKLDWRLANGNTANSHLLDGIWNKLCITGAVADEHLSAITSVAYYQPKRALELANKCMRQGSTSSYLPELIKYAAYNQDYLTSACEILWSLAKKDSTKTSQCQDQSINILKDMCSALPNQPIEYNELLVDFGLSVMNQPDSWSGKYTPYDFLKGILQTEGHINEYSDGKVSINPFLVLKEAVSFLRHEVIDVAITLLDSENIKIAILSASQLADALHYPFGMFNKIITEEEKAPWTVEFIETLEKIKGKILSSSVKSLVWLELLHTISWHASFGDEKTKELANQIIDLQPTSLEFKATSRFLDGYGHLPKYINAETSYDEWQISIQNTAKEIASTFTIPNKLLEFVLSILTQLDKHILFISPTPEKLLNEILISTNNLAEQFLDYILLNPDSVITKYVPIVLPQVYSENIETGRKLTSALLNSKNPELRLLITKCIYQILKHSAFGKYELDVMERFITSSCEVEIRNTVNALHQFDSSHQVKLLELIKITNFCDSSIIAETTLSLFTKRGSLSYELLDVDTLKIIFNKMVAISVLNKSFTQEFLSLSSIKFPFETLDFFIKRTEHAILKNDYSYKTHSQAIRKIVKMWCRDSAIYEKLCDDAWLWMRNHHEENYSFKLFASPLLSTLFLPLKDQALSFIENKIAGDIIDFALVNLILRKTESTFSLENPVFVEKHLELALRRGQQYYDTALAGLYNAARSKGAQWVKDGEPCAADLEAFKKASFILDKLKRFSAPYKLYEWIQQDAKNSIDESCKNKDSFDE